MIHLTSGLSQSCRVVLLPVKIVYGISTNQAPNGYASDRSKARLWKVQLQQKLVKVEPLFALTISNNNKTENNAIAHRQREVLMVSVDRMQSWRLSI